MKEFLPCIKVQKGFYTSSLNSNKRFFSFGNLDKNIYQVYHNNNNNKHNKNIINSNNFLVVSNVNKDEINSTKNNTAITFYNRGLSEKNNNNNFGGGGGKGVETCYNKGTKGKFEFKKNKFENLFLNSYNNIRILKGFNNGINIVNKNVLKNFQLILPEVQNDNTKNKKVFNNKSLPATINENNRQFNISNTSSLIKIKKELNNKNILNHDKIDCQNISSGKNKDPLTAIGFLDNKENKYSIINDKNNFTNKKTLSTGAKYNKNENEENNEKNSKNLTMLFNNIKCIKSFSNISNINNNLKNNNNINNKNNNKIILKNKITKNKISNNINNINANVKICPLCHKEKEIYKFAYHLSLHPSKIFDWLYLGSYRNACDKQEIKNLGINYVLNCAVECRETFPPHVKYCHLKISDRPKFRIYSYLDKASDFINQAQSNNGTILVHCQLGISRSTTCVISYFIKYMGYTAMNALNFIKKKRTQVMPNFGFLEQLIIYEKNNLGTGKK